VPSYDGRNREPVFLPRSADVADARRRRHRRRHGDAHPPHNAVELWEAQIACLNGKPFSSTDFPQGGRVDVADYDDGRGKVAVRAVLDAPTRARGDPRDPAYTTTESLVASIESAIQRGRVQISSINDYTTDKVEIELELSRGVRRRRDPAALCVHGLRRGGELEPHRGARPQAGRNDRLRRCAN
jgi:topoisomerase-4 subunit A